MKSFADNVEVKEKTMEVLSGITQDNSKKCFNNGIIDGTSVLVLGENTLKEIEDFLFKN